MSQKRGLFAIVSWEGFMFGAESVFPSIQPYSAWFFWGGVIGLFVWAGWVYSDMHQGIRPDWAFWRWSKRIPLNEFCSFSEGKGWDFGVGSLDPLDLARGLKQAIADKEIRVWGREPNKDGPLIELSGDYWKKYEIDPLSFTRINNRGDTQGVVSDNQFTRTFYPMGGSQHKDIHLERLQAIRWFRRESGQYKGLTAGES